MAKGWVKIDTVNDVPEHNESQAEKRRRFHNFENSIRNMKSMSAFEMKEHSEELCAAREAQEESLIQAYNDKRLKSAKAIKEAQRLIKAREKTAEKKRLLNK